jgi:Glycosyltransferase WbsX
MFVPTIGPTGGYATIEVLAFYLPQFHPIPENDEFFELTYMDKDAVARGKAFEAIAPGCVSAQVARR